MGTAMNGCPHFFIPECSIFFPCHQTVVFKIQLYPSFQQHNTQVTGTQCSGHLCEAFDYRAFSDALFSVLFRLGIPFPCHAGEKLLH